MLVSYQRVTLTLIQSCTITTPHFFFPYICPADRGTQGPVDPGMDTESLTLGHRAEGPADPGMDTVSLTLGHRAEGPDDPGMDTESLTFGHRAEGPVDPGMDTESLTLGHRAEGPADPGITLCKMVPVLEASKYNWFHIVEYVERESGLECEMPEVKKHLEAFYAEVLSTVDPLNRPLLQQSYHAFQATSQELENSSRTAATLNGEIVSDSENDPCIPVTSVASPEAKKVIAMRRKSLARKARRKKAKVMAEKRFLQRKVTRKVKTVAERFPGIGREIESYVRSCDVGADCWRRTGVLTFDGNQKINKKVTFQRIREHLQDVYGQKFSYGTVVQLCIARNRRRRAAKNYRGIAHVTSRRARKGFQLKYNPDTHWSSALYRSLDYVQYHDGTNITILNRDDASGYRLDTLATNRQHRTLVVNGSPTVTTHTDYVNRYPATLQTTSYNFTGTNTTGELCAGVVKPAKVYPKNPAQHYADLQMLNAAPELEPAFVNPLTRKPKEIECIRVDGVGDEGPAHLEVQFWWAARHREEEKMITMVTSRSSGSSYLNRVELQNGCLALAHANLFIPSTLNGVPINPRTGSVDMELVRSNMDLATNIYIERVNQCPCGDATIHVYKGAGSKEHQEKRTQLTIFLKGSNKSKDRLRQEKPKLFAYFQKVWRVRNQHLQQGLPAQYVFLLVCCFKPDCPHPLCEGNQQHPPPQMKWFNDGPSIGKIPLPVADPSRPWGDLNCSTCQTFCSSHFLKPKEVFETKEQPMAQPPSVLLKEFFLSLKGVDATEKMVEDIAKKTLLSPRECKMWLGHLKTVHMNRKRGAAKAAQSRKKKQAQGQDPEEECLCGVCGVAYESETEEEELWIGCDSCTQWFHATTRQLCVLFLSSVVCVSLFYMYS